MGEKEQGTPDDMSARAGHIKMGGVEGERAGGGFIKMGGVEGELWKGVEEMGLREAGGGGSGAGIAVSDPGAPGDKAGTKK